MALSTIFSELLISWQPNFVWYQKPECPVKIVGLLHWGSRSQRRVKMLMFVQRISFNHQTFCLQTWYYIMQELIWSKYDNVYCIFWTADTFATKLGLIVQHYKLECTVEKLGYCIQDQGHSKGSKCQWMFVRMIFSEPRNIFSQTCYSDAAS